MESKKKEVKEKLEHSEIHDVKHYPDNQEVQDKNEGNGTSTENSFIRPSASNPTVPRYQNSKIVSKSENQSINEMLANLLKDFGVNLKFENDGETLEEERTITEKYISKISSLVKSKEIGLTSLRKEKMFRIKYMQQIENENESLKKRVNDLMREWDEVTDTMILPAKTDFKKSTTTVTNWSYTEVPISKINYVWTIKNFSFCRKKKKKFIKSPMVSSYSNTTKWYLILHPEGDVEESEDFVSLFLHLDITNLDGVNANYKVSILDCKRNKENLVEDTQDFEVGKGWGWSKFIERESLFDKSENLLPNDELTIFCEITEVRDSIDISGKIDLIELKIPKYELSRDFEMLLENQKLTDVVFHVGSKEFKAHKTILAARSTVFAAMFERNMREKLLNEVTIKDCSENVFKELLCFIYTDEVRDSSSDAASLLIAAEKYNLMRLKVMCENILIRNLTLENAIKILILADLFNAKYLKAKTIDYIITHSSKIVYTVAWKKLFFSHSVLAAEVVQTLAVRSICLPEPKQIMK